MLHPGGNHPCGVPGLIIKGPDNPTSQLLPIMSTKCCSGGEEGRKDKGGGGGCGDKVAYESWCVTKKDDVCV